MSKTTAGKVKETGAKPNQILVGINELNRGLRIKVYSHQTPEGGRITGQFDLETVGDGKYASFLNMLNEKRFNNAADLIAKVLALGGENCTHILNRNELKIEDSSEPINVKLNLAPLKFKINKTGVDSNYIKEIDELIANKTDILKDNYSPNVVLNLDWQELKECLLIPIYKFQEILFHFDYQKRMAKDVGVKFAQILEEVMRDGVLTKIELEYLTEKGIELGIESEKINSFLENGGAINLGFRKIIYEVCKDGVITDNEKEYIREKAQDYELKKELVEKELKEISNYLHCLHILFEKDLFYESIIYFFMHRFLIKDNNSENFFLTDVSEMLTTNKYHKNFLASQKALFKKEITSFLNSYTSSEEFNDCPIHTLASYLGLNIISYSEIKNEQIKSKAICDMKKIFSSIIPEDNIKEKHEIQNSETLIVGQDTYEFKYFNNPFYSLFDYNVVGALTIIEVNKSHYFYKEDLDFKLLLISMISNLKRNYANKELINEILYLLNPPSKIKIYFPRNKFK